MKYIEVSVNKRDHIFDYTLVDDIDFEWLSDLSWRISSQYAAHGANSLYMHRLVLLAKNNFRSLPQGLYTDHLNRNKLDNRQKNLRLCTPLENSWNRKTNKNKASSQFVGVIFDKKLNKWSARIEHKMMSI